MDSPAVPDDPRCEPAFRHHRRSRRWRGHDYGQPGSVFLTLCTFERACLFGEIVDGRMHLNGAGRIAERCWLEIPRHFPQASLDRFVIMPNHVHGIIRIQGQSAATPSPTPVRMVGAKNLSPLPDPHAPFASPSRTIGSIVRGFKIGVTKWIRQHTDIHCVWQRNYFDHVVRDDASLDRIRGYIAGNPAHWEDDPENPQASPP